jgi:fructokinase
MTDFLVIGECVADIVRTPGRPDVPHPGGSPANVAYGLARLGRSTALLTQLGEDDAGELIGAHLRSAGVEVVTDGQHGVATPTAVVTLDAAGTASYDFSVDWTLRPVPVPAVPGHVHLGSIGAVHEPGASAAVALTARQRPHATVSYDPNVRPALFGDRAAAVGRVERCVALADVVKASDEDAAWLYPGEPLDRVAARWLASGPAVVFVTLGAEGALAYARGLRVAQAPVRTEVADTVGAGDAFMAAVLDALKDLGATGTGGRAALDALGADAVRGVLRHAATAAALTVSRRGANPPDRAELRAARALCGAPTDR